ncbi:hypothetical protein MPSEU_000144500 [Mayamaea pseudoterrestris]|nr:hypothetical protein MPSEU_000144500 [Mayamaea pseudoterrestris]
MSSHNTPHPQEHICCCYPIRQEMARHHQPELPSRSDELTMPVAIRNVHGAYPAFHIFILLLISTQCADSFVLSHANPHARTNRRRNNLFPATKLQEITSTAPDSVTTSETWSLSASNARSESRFGLRRRVKAVLQNAKNRTGLPNLNSEDDAFVESSISSQSMGKAFDDAEEYLFHEELDDFVALPNEEVPIAVRSNYVAPVKTVDQSTPVSSISAQAQKPLPFTLPTLTEEQNELLRKGERVQYQAKMGGEGNGFVVVDVQAPPYVVWECLLDFEAYPEQIDTVRSMRMFTSTHLNSSYIAEDPVLPALTRNMRHYGRASVTRASFVLSKFRLNIAAVHKYRPHPDGHYMTFTLDKACKNVVLQDAKGIWYTQACPDGRQDYTRVWLLCELKVSPLLPTFIVDYAARRAMPRATTWLKPVVETSANRWLGTGM